MNALRMAALEAKIGLKSTYYFRVKKCSFDSAIIRNIHAMGHEIGYHYECLSDADGDLESALVDFEIKLATLRQLVPVATCSMHGAPLKRIDNRDMWRTKHQAELLRSKFGILGEIYLGIDYSDIAYINDTGRNWTSHSSNVRDSVRSLISADFSSGEQLLEYFRSSPHPKICFQVHPERWDDHYIAWGLQALKDNSINLIKAMLKYRRQRSTLRISQTS